MAALERVERIELSSSEWRSDIISHYTTLAFMLSRQVSNLKSSEPKSDVLPIPPQDNGDEPTDLCTVRPPLNYSLTQGAGRLIIWWVERDSNPRCCV